MIEKVCDECHGNRLKPYSLAVKIGKYNIIDMTNLPVDELKEYLTNLHKKGNDKEIAAQLLKTLIADYSF